MKIRCSVICLSAELYICKKLSNTTNGSFAVAVDNNHLSELIFRHTTPPAEIIESHESLFTQFVYMGFPKKTFDMTPIYAFDGRKAKLTTNAFVCPRCFTRATEIPTQCVVCGLQLNSSSHIARSYHHLIPVQNFVEIRSSDDNEVQRLGEFVCHGCHESIPLSSMQLQCSCCRNIFCLECDVFIHDSLHNCPGCELVQENSFKSTRPG